MPDWLLLLSLTALLATGVALSFVQVYWTEHPSPVDTLTGFLKAFPRLSLLSRAGLLTVPVGALALVFLAGAFSFNLFQQPSNTVKLPVEVIGPDGHTVSIQVNTSRPSDVEYLYLKAHSIGYPYHLADGRGYSTDKASIKLNNGSWLDVNNNTVDCEEPEASVRCIDGPMHTVRFRIPISDLGSLNDGSNSIHFRFNYANPSGDFGAISTGYRILDVELQSSGGSNHLDGTSFVWDNPGEWSAPEGYGSNSDVEDGKALWYRRDHMIEGWNGEPITASCADCHVDDGYDLEYFAYSNESIVQRSRYHGLSESEGKKIAAYIRSLDIKTESGRSIDPPGRPWNPPYQPGETSSASRAPEASRSEGTAIDDMEPVYWAAGAGHKWALDSDTEMKKFLFPDGITKDAITAEGRLNMRELPVALQMPDWNEWLPAVHPIDVWGSDFKNSKVWDYYLNEVPDFVENGDIGGVRWAMQTIWKQVKDGFRPKSAPAPYDDETNYRVAYLSRMQWALTKSFETMQPNHFEDDSKDLYGSAAEPLQWPSMSRVLFDQAPHIQGHVKGPGNEIMDRYHDAAWYQHQLTLNPGSGISTGLKPVDWKYHYMHMNAPSESGPHAWRTLASYAKSIQVAEKLPNDYSSHQPEGWYLRHLTPALVDMQHQWSEHLSGLNSDDYRRALNSILSALSEGMTPEPLSEWSRQEGQHGIEPSDWNPSRQYGNYDRVTYPDHFWTALDNFGELGVAYEVLKPLAEWSNEAWPNGDWMKHIEPYKDNPSTNEGPSNKAPSVQLVTPEEGATFQKPASVTLEATASDSDGNVDQVEFFVDGTSIGTDSEATYTTSWSDIDAGYYTITAVATDDAGGTTESDPIDVTVETENGTVPVEPAVNYEYYEESWSQLPDFDSMSPVQTSTTSTISTAPAQRDDNFGIRFTAYLEVPAGGSYTFSLTSDDGSSLSVDDSLLIENDGIHAPSEKQGTVQLTEGYHAITVEYFEASGGETLNLQWESDSISKEPIPKDRLYPEIPSNTIEQTIELQAGWNLVSSRVEPSDPSMEAVFGDALSDMIITKDEAGRVYSPSYNVTALTTWQAEEAYQVYMTESHTITIEGTPVATDESIPLVQGWNLVPYYPTAEMPAEDAFASLGESLVIVKDYAGQAYIPDPEYDINELGTVKPTLGYKVYVNQADTLSYPTTTGTKAVTDAQPSEAKSKAGSSSRGIGTSATVLVKAPNLSDGTTVYAEAQGQVVGSSAISDGTAMLTVRGKDPYTSDDAKGAETGDKLTFVAGSDRDAVDIQQAENLIEEKSADTPVTFAPDALLSVTPSPAPETFRLGKNQPNPAQTSTTISFSVPEASDVTLSLYNVIGQRVATFIDERMEAGSHEVEVDVSTLSSGVYFYRLEANSNRDSRKMTVVR